MSSLSIRKLFEYVKLYKYFNLKSIKSVSQLFQFHVTQQFHIHWGLLLNHIIIHLIYEINNLSVLSFSYEQMINEIRWLQKWKTQICQIRKLCYNHPIVWSVIYMTQREVHRHILIRRVCSKIDRAVSMPFEPYTER